MIFESLDVWLNGVYVCVYMRRVQRSNDVELYLLSFESEHAYVLQLEYCPIIWVLWQNSLNARAQGTTLQVFNLKGSIIQINCLKICESDTFQ